MEVPVWCGMRWLWTSLPPSLLVCTCFKTGIYPMTPVYNAFSYTVKYYMWYEQFYGNMYVLLQSWCPYHVLLLGMRRSHDSSEHGVVLWKYHGRWSRLIFLTKAQVRRMVLSRDSKCAIHVLPTLRILGPKQIPDEIHDYNEICLQVTPFYLKHLTKVSKYIIYYIKYPWHAIFSCLTHYHKNNIKNTMSACGTWHLSSSSQTKRARYY